MGVDAQAMLQQQNANRNLGSAAKQLKISPYDVGLADNVGDYARAFEASLSNPLYLQVAEKLGIKSYNSINDYAKVLDALTGGLAIGNGGASGSNNGNGTKLPAPNDGSYGNIITNTNFEGNLGTKQADLYNNKQVDSSGGNPIQADSIVTAADQQLAAVDPAATQAAAIKAQSDAQMKALQDLMIQQDQAYKQQLELQQQQIAAANAAYQEQQRQSDALSRAYIPAPSRTAASPVFGTFNGGSKSSSSLSSLAIGGKQMGGSSLSGLQIA